MQGTSVAEGRYYTISGAAKRLGKHRHTVSHWINEGEFPVTRIGKAVKISEETLRDMAARPDRRIRLPKAESSVQRVQKISGTYYTAGKTAALLGKHLNTIIRWVNEGRLPAVRLGNALLISEEAIRSQSGDEQIPIDSGLDRLHTCCR